MTDFDPTKVPTASHWIKRSDHEKVQAFEIPDHGDPLGWGGFGVWMTMCAVPDWTCAEGDGVTLNGVTYPSGHFVVHGHYDTVVLSKALLEKNYERVR